MGDMAELSMEEAKRQWLSEHRGDGSEADYQRYLQIEEEVEYQTMTAALDAVLDALKDGTYWLGKGRVKIPINRLTKTHAANIRRWLEIRATIFHDHACLKFMAGAPSNLATEAAADFDRAFDLLNAMPPKEWLRDQTLIKNLKIKEKRKLVKLNG